MKKLTIRVLGYDVERDGVLYDYSGAKVDWFAMAARRRVFGEILVNSVMDMVYKIQARVIAKNARIGKLVFYGHGNIGLQYIGQDPVALRNLESKGYENSLATLKPLFASDGLVILHGCHVGANESFLKALSSIFGVPVRAGTELQYIQNFGLEGASVQCDEVSCTTRYPNGLDFFLESFRFM